MGELKCYKCGKPISFDSKIKSKTGKYIPLDPTTHTPHNCEKQIIHSSRPSKSSSKKGVAITIASLILVFVVIGGIAAIANSGNYSNTNNIEHSGAIESQNQAAKSGSSNSITTSSYNSDGAGYFSGKVTGIVDGDTIKVDGKSVRLALASTPEINTAMGKAAKSYLQEICPMGSTVTVDEDSGQTEGSYGRIVAKVTCNGVNLNQAILEKGYGHLSFCDKSEFSGDSWSGCSSPTKSSSYSGTYSGSYSSSGSNCDPNYSGVCIPIDSPDLDCSDFSGPVTVSGNDRHGLDRDGDGIGCE